MWSPSDAGTGSLYNSEFTFELQQDGTEHGHVTSTAFAMDSLDTSISLEVWEQSPAYQTCFEQQEANNLQQAFPGQGTIDSVTSAPLDVALPLPGNAYQSTIHYHLQNGFSELRPVGCTTCSKASSQSRFT